MLQRKPANRLGYNGISEIKDHPWLKYYPWDDLYEKKLEAPFLPKNLDNYDKKYCEGPDKIGNDTLERYQNYYKSEALNEIFINYSFENLISLSASKEEKIKNGKNNSINSNGNSNNNNILPRKSKSGTTNANYISSNLSQNKIHFNNSTASPQKRRINSSLGGLAVSSKNTSLNNLLKNRMKITESLYLNQPNNASNLNINNYNNNDISNNNIINGNFININQSQNIVSKPSPAKSRTGSLNINSTSIKSSNILSPNHVRNISSNSNLSIAINCKQSKNIGNNNNGNLIVHTPHKNRSVNNLNLLKSRGKNISINSTAKISNLTNIPASNLSVNNVHQNKNINININPSSSVNLNLKQSSATPYRNAMNALKSGSERLPFIEQKLANFRQFSSNLANAKKISHSPSIKNSAKSAVVNDTTNKNPISNNNNNENNRQQKSVGKYSTLSASANSTGSSTVSMNFLHKRSGSTNTFNNY